MIKFNWSGIWESVVANKGKVTIGALAIVLFFVALYMTDCFSNWSFNRGVKKDKVAIENNINAIKQANAQIANLEQVKVEAQANVNAAVKEYADQTYGLDNAKTETNKALANLDRAVKANSNIDRTAEDLVNKLKELDGQ